MTNKPIVLIIEDEEHIASLLQTNLQLEGYLPLIAEDGRRAMTTVENQRIDLIIMDVMLPDTSGIDLCRKIKHNRRDIPILMLSALGQSKDRIKGLKAGADDYLAKPFDLQELLLRMSNLLGRFSQDKQIQKLCTFGKATIDFATFTILSNGTNHTMTSKEAHLLKYMIERANEVVSRKDILEHVWNYEVYPNTRTIDNFVATYRKWIEVDPSNPVIIKTVRGIGYLFKTVDSLTV